MGWLDWWRKPRLKREPEVAAPRPKRWQSALPAATRGRLREILAAHQMIVLFFWAHWDSSSNRYEQQVLLRLQAEFGDKVAFFAVDVDEEPDLTAAYAVVTTPTLICLVQGEEAHRLVGVRSVGSLRQWLTSGDESR